MARLLSNVKLILVSIHDFLNLCADFIMSNTMKTFLNGKVPRQSNSMLVVHLQLLHVTFASTRHVIQPCRIS